MAKINLAGLVIGQPNQESDVLARVLRHRMNRICIAKDSTINSQTFESAGIQVQRFDEADLGDLAQSVDGNTAFVFTNETSKHAAGSIFGSSHVPTIDL